MKWLKHMSATRRDERIAALIDEHGFEGYGFFWAVTEVIAEQMPAGGDLCEVGYSPKRWGQLLGCHHGKVKKYLTALEVHGLVTINSVGGLLVVRSPNLVKYRDEYSKKSRQGKESLRRVSPLEGEGEKETDSESKKLVVVSTVRNGHGGQSGRCTFPVLRNNRHRDCGDVSTSDSTLCVVHHDLMAKIKANEVVSS